MHKYHLDSSLTLFKLRAYISIDWRNTFRRIYTSLNGHKCVLEDEGFGKNPGVHCRQVDISATPFIVVSHMFTVCNVLAANIISTKKAYVSRRMGLVLVEMR